MLSNSMGKSVLIIGFGKGIGGRLVGKLDGFSQYVGVSRSANCAVEGVLHIQSRAEDLPKHVDQIKSKVSLVIYAASEFGESAEMLTEEYDQFMNAGPRGALAAFNALKDEGLLEEGALFIGIGSISSENVPSREYAHQVYSIAKFTQKTIMARLAAQHPKYRFATITLGSIGEDAGNADKGIGYEHVIRTIEYLYAVSSRSNYSEVELVSALDL